MSSRTHRRKPIPKREGLLSTALPNWPEEIVGRKYVRVLERLASSLRDKQAHGNRRLHLDDVLIAYLLAFFNCALRTLRTLEDFSQSRQAQRHLSVPRLPRSTLSDFNRVVDPRLLDPLVEHLRTEVARRGDAVPTDLPGTLGKVLAVDSSFFNVAADVVWGVMHRTNRGQKKQSARLDVHLDVRSWLPEIIDVGQAGESETDSAVRHVKPGAIHVYDRGIFSFELVDKQREVGADFVHRLRKEGPRCPRFTPDHSRPLTEADQRAGVLRDTIGRLTGSTHRQPPDMQLREVVIQSPDEPGGEIRLLTNLLDLDAAVIGQLYRYRWQIELFFRWLKCYANCAHLISESRQGVLLSFYVTVIGVLLMYLHTGSRPSKYAFNLMGLVAQGSATLEEILPILRERERQCQLDRESAARRAAAKKKS